MTQQEVTAVARLIASHSFYTIPHTHVWRHTICLLVLEYNRGMGTTEMSSLVDAVAQILIILQLCIFGDVRKSMKECMKKREKMQGN